MPSLKFDVNLISLPSSIHAQVEPWDNAEEENCYDFREASMAAEEITKYGKNGD